MRRVVVKDEASKQLVFLTNNFRLKPELIANYSVNFSQSQSQIWSILGSLSWSV